MLKDYIDIDNLKIEWMSPNDSSPNEFKANMKYVWICFLFIVLFLILRDYVEDNTT